MSKVLKKAAEILVECENIKDVDFVHKCEAVLFEGDWNIKYYYGSMSLYFHDVVNPFIDTLEGRIQADTIEDWLINTQLAHSEFNFMATNPQNKIISYHQWRLDRIKWCLEQLGEQDE